MRRLVLLGACCATLASCELFENLDEEQVREGGRAVGGVVGGAVGGGAGAALGESIGEIAGTAAFAILAALGIVKGVKKAKAAHQEKLEAAFLDGQRLQKAADGGIESRKGTLPSP